MIFSHQQPDKGNSMLRTINRIVISGFTIFAISACYPKYEDNCEYYRKHYPERYDACLATEGRHKEAFNYLIEQDRQKKARREAAERERENSMSASDWANIIQAGTNELNKTTQQLQINNAERQARQASNSSSSTTINETSGSNYPNNGSNPKCDSTYSAEPTCTLLKNSLRYYCESRNRAAGSDFNYCVRECINQYQAKANSITSCIDPASDAPRRDGPTRVIDNN